MARKLILAALGWLTLAGANHPAANAPNQDQTGVNRQGDADTDKAAETIARAINNTVQPAVQDSGCNDRKDKRESDLCAQWKAADAARDAANYAFWALLLTTVGTGLLYWTLRETRFTARRQLRAYVYAEPTKLTNFARSRRIEVEYAIRNGGSTPAYDVVHGGGINVLPVRDAKEFFGLQDPDVRTGEETPVVIHSGQQTFGAVEQQDFVIDDELLRLLATGGSALYVWGFIDYRDTFKRRRRTRFCYRLNGERFASSTQESRRNPGVMIAMEWTMAPFHNDAT